MALRDQGEPTNIAMAPHGQEQRELTTRQGEQSSSTSSLHSTSAPDLGN